MNKIANVIFAYKPTNDDELELTVGDKIEVIGYEEEGWWKGRLKGRVGVFPSNFVQVAESSSPGQQQQVTSTSNKLNSVFGSLVNTKNSTISSNSLNNITSNSNNNLSNINNNNSTSSNNLIMNTQQQQQQPPHHENRLSSEYPLHSAGEDSLHSNSSLGERRPKPLRGMGYGDIFSAGAKVKPLPADPMASKITGATASERPSTLSGSGLSGTLQKPIPKKPPPPAPADINNAVAAAAAAGATNGSSTASSDQAPALPPKPGNSYSPFLQQRPLPTQPAQRATREQARVIFAYTPTNSDELAMQVGDIIDVLDKNIEDAGWWKGELNGKVGVFPDNFVQLISGGNVGGSKSVQDWHSSAQSGQSSNNTSANTSGSGFAAAGTTSSTEGRIKSVFAGTPKGFSKELESNLEKHNNNPASFLSLKRNKLQQQMSSSGLPPSDTTQGANVSNVLESSNNINTNSIPASLSTRPNFSETQNGHTTATNTTSLLETSPSKLNHITANRAKGPTRRPPTNILNKRNQSNDLAVNNDNHHKRNSIELKEDHPSSGLPSFNNQAPATTTVSKPSLQAHLETVSCPPVKQEQTPREPASVISSRITSLGTSSSPFSSTTTTPAVSSEPVSPLSMGGKFQSSPINSNNVPDNNSNQTPTLTTTPKTNQRAAMNQGPVIAGQQHHETTTRSKLTSTSSSTSSTPPWMVELRKTNAEKKRDPPSSTASMMEEIIAPNTTASAVSAPTTPAATTATTTTTTSVATPPSSSTVAAAIAPTVASKTIETPVATKAPVAPVAIPAAVATVAAVVPPLSSTVTSPPKQPQTATTPASTSETIATTTSEKSELSILTSKYDGILKQISDDVQKEIKGLKDEVKKLREDFGSIDELRDTLEAMKIELKTCQSATESQRRYIKDLVNNLADERKRIAAMQVEIDGNLK